MCISPIAAATKFNVANQDGSLQVVSIINFLRLFDEQREQQAVFYPNCFTPNLQTDPVKYSTGFLLISFELCNQKDLDGGQKILNKLHFVFATWVNNGKLYGLIKVRNCSKFTFKKYWTCIADFFDENIGPADPATNDFNLIADIPVVDVHVNSDPVNFDDSYPIEAGELKLTTVIPEADFKGKTHLYFPEGKLVWKINLFPYMPYIKNGKPKQKKISIEDCDKLLEEFTIKYFINNELATIPDVVRAMNGINFKNLYKPKRKEEIEALVESIHNRLSKGQIDIEALAEKQYTFFNKKNRLNSSERGKITMRWRHIRNGTDSLTTKRKIVEAIQELNKEGLPVTTKNLSQKTGFNLRRLQRQNKKYQLW